MSRLKLVPPEGYYDDPFADKIRQRLSRNENTMMCFLGTPRRGKSYAAMTAGGMVDARHDFDHTHIRFLPQDYLDAIQHRKPGCFIILDESGSEFSARRFQSLENQLMSATLQTFGSRLINTAWCVPNLKLQDVNATRLVNYSVKMLNAPFRKGVGVLYRHFAGEYSGKPYRYTQGTVSFGPPFQDDPKELDEYEGMKAQYQSESYDRYWEEFAKKYEDRQNGSHKLTMQEMTEIAAKVIEAPEKYTVLGRKNVKKFDSLLIARAENVTEPQASKILRLVVADMQRRGLTL